MDHAEQIRELVRASYTHRDPRVRREAIERASRLLDVVCEQPEARFPRTNVPGNVTPVGPLHPPMPGYYLQCQIPPDKILTVPDVPLVQPGTISEIARLNLSAQAGCKRGILIGVHGTVRDDTAGVEDAGAYEYASMGVEISFNGDENIITDGEAISFAPYSDMFSPGDRLAFPIYRPVSDNDRLVFRWQNFQPAATGNALQPSLTFLFIKLPED
jgi:hypothetical protein